MTSPVTPPAAPVVPLYPPLGSATFNADAYAYGTAMPGVVDGINDLAENAHTNALSANESATAAQQSALDASNAAAPALAASNFKGEWSTLTGALAKPACVKHSGRFWLLLVDLPDVTLSEPGVAEDWAPTDGGVAPTAVITVSTVAVPGVCYVLAASGITLTLAAAYTKGVYQGVRTVEGVTGCAVDFGAHLYQGRDVGLLQLDVPLVRLDFNYETPVIGMR